MTSEIRILIIGLLWAGLLTAATEQESREIWDNGFRAKRPVAVKTEPTGPVKSVEYQSGWDGLTNAKTSAAPIIGVTLWLVRPVAGDSDGARLLVQDTEFVAQRVRTDETLHPGQKIRLGFEAPREGYLYVIDRERYSDGTTGAPYLIFPAATLNAGDNRVRPGRLVEVPGQADPVKTFSIRPKDPRYSGEELLVIVSPEPLPAVTPGEKETPLPPALVEEWQKQWDAPVMRLDMTAKEGMWTVHEKAAGASQRLLTQDDLMPQSIFAGDVPQNRPVLVRVPIEVKP